MRSVFAANFLRRGCMVRRRWTPGDCVKHRPTKEEVLSAAHSNNSIVVRSCTTFATAWTTTPISMEPLRKSSSSLEGMVLLSSLQHHLQQSFYQTRCQYFSTMPDKDRRQQNEQDLPKERRNHGIMTIMKCDSKEEKDSSSQEPLELQLMLRDETLKCSQHLDPDGNTLPTSDWVHIHGILPIGSLHQLLFSLERIILEEEQKGIIDLDADWNPVQDAAVPLLSFDRLAQEGRSLIQAAHVVISPFGRPNGWHVKFANRSLAYAILSREEQQNIRIGWKLVHASEYHYSKKRQQEEDPAWRDNNGLVFDDSMVRIENCPPEMDVNYVRHIFSRYELAHHGKTVLTWKGETNDGKVAPLMYIVRMESPAWARAAVRELQSTMVNHKNIRLVQYPQQIRYEDF